MANEIDGDTRSLCLALSTRAGMLLEDASAKAILLGDLQREELRSAIREAQDMAEQAGALLAAAEMLMAH